MAEISQILSQIEDGDPNAADQLLPLIYGELRMLVESARRKRRLRHGADFVRQPLDDLSPSESLELPDDLLDLDAALEKLAQKDARKAELVKLRFFAGLSVQQAAAALDIAPSTADRDWAYAKAWLFREISRGGTAAAE